jgi:hypothetical protein
MKFFDTDAAMHGRLPEKRFFYGIMFTVRKDLMMSMLEECNMRRISYRQQMFGAHEPVNIDGIWMQKLLEFPKLHEASKYHHLI